MARAVRDPNRVPALIVVSSAADEAEVQLWADPTTHRLYVDTSDIPPDIDVTTHTNYAKKYYTSAGTVTDGIVWSPAAGKRWHVVSLYIQVSAAATVTLEDDLAAGDSPVWKGELAANSGVAIPFDAMYPLASGEDAADLLITTSAGNVYVTAVGYEI